MISTVSVGHLDSLADVVAKITGAAPRQTMPNSVVRAAGEVELVDVTPEASHAHNATQLVLGATPRTWPAVLRPAASIRSRVIRRGGGLDVHIVTCQRRPGPMRAHAPATAWWAT